MKDFSWELVAFLREQHPSGSRITLKQVGNASAKTRSVERTPKTYSQKRTVT